MRDVRGICTGCVGELEGIWKEFGRNLEEVWRGSERDLKGICTSRAGVGVVMRASTR
jgi:hypothetical protein